MTRTIPKIGHIVRDATTGFTGTATQYIEMLSGTVQLAAPAEKRPGGPTTRAQRPGC